MVVIIGGNKDTERGAIMRCERIKELRNEFNLTQKDMAEIIGVTKQSVSNYETGHREPSLETFVKICEHFNVSADYILNLSDTRETMEFSAKNKVNHKIKVDTWARKIFDTIGELNTSCINTNNEKPCVRCEEFYRCTRSIWDEYQGIYVRVREIQKEEHK